jgi:NADPH-dependent glutamate synthase beta subunit-like oxidoreductase/NAD(P)H-flavin reductase
MQDFVPCFGFGITFEDFYSSAGLGRIDGLFLEELNQSDASLSQRLLAARASPDTVGSADESAIIVALAPYLEAFIGSLFGIADAQAQAQAGQDALSPLFDVKRNFIIRRVAKEYSPDQAAQLDGPGLQRQLAELLGGPFDELYFAKAVQGWMAAPDLNAQALAVAVQWAAWQSHCVRHGPESVLFHLPHKHDPLHLVSAKSVALADGVKALAFPDEALRCRDGFDLTDSGHDLAGALDQVHYCILCHHQGKDSCSKGLPDRKGGGLAKSAVGVTLAGCPLEEKISEMHEVRAQGLVVAALAVAVIDNPLVAGTGHRICNDCMAACIYQGQNRDPVDIPQAETRILKDVLALPLGVEIYGLLTRWNPLDLRRPLPRPDTGRKILVVGVGPAGAALSHHLLQDGHCVAAVDGLKIEPLPADVSGVLHSGARVPFRPIVWAKDLWEPLGERRLYGFGGVAEYGITARWDKNFLTVIRLLLERRSRFMMVGGVRFGGALTFAQALELGFDHVALATGAGKPTIVKMPGGLARGVRQASDFLMALQLTGAAHKDSVANLQIRLPVVVIGGGLTAIDTCTEALAYYPVQVEKFLCRYEALVQQMGEAAVRAQWSEEDGEIADEFIAHAQAIRSEREVAAREMRSPDIRGLLDRWGGGTIAYRRRLVDSPAYRNFEEVNKALEEGIRFAETLSPVAVHVDRHGHAETLEVADADGAHHRLPARSILVAAGTVPNTSLAREQEGVPLDGKYYQALDENWQTVSPEHASKPEHAHVLMAVDGIEPGRASFFGDLHPSFAGNVVSAMASAKRGYPAISRALAGLAGNPVPASELFRTLDDGLRPRVEAVRRLTPTIVEVVVRAPFAAQAFHPGQFYRLQNYEANAAKVNGTALAMEGIALTGAWTDPAQGLVGLIVLEMGGSSNLAALLKPGEPVVLMGPTGAPTEIATGETVLLAGGGLGNAVLFSIGRALRQAGSCVLYFAAYRDARDRFKVAEIEAAADVVVWCVDQGDPFVPSRPQDRSFVGTIIDAIAAYGEGALGAVQISLSAVDRIIAIGSDKMMAALALARHRRLAPFLGPEHIGIGSINSPMQCMMKEICAQCLQRHVDPVTGEDYVVFTCSHQDQDLDRVDFANLADRLAQNAVSEKLTKAWLARCLNDIGPAV